MQCFKLGFFCLLLFVVLPVMTIAQTPNVEQIINRYIEAVGGKSAIEKINSRFASGVLTDKRGNKSPVEQYLKLPELGLLQINPNSPSEYKQWFDGSKGFTVDTQTSTREMTGAVLIHWRRNNNLHLPIRLNEFFTKIEFKENRKKDGRELSCLTMTPPVPSDETWCFDDKTGLLYSRSFVFGQGSKFEFMYEDYRSVSGIMIPFVVKVVDQVGTQTTEWQEIKLNVPIDDAKFGITTAKVENVIAPDNTKLYDIKTEELVTSSGQKYTTEKGFLRVSENRTKSNSNTIELAVMRIRSKAANPASPLIYLAGGPGNSALGEARVPFMIRLFEDILQTRDVILFDQRGTGQSRPAVVWASPESLPPESLISEQKIINYVRSQSEKAVVSFNQRKIDLTGYNTIESADDINDLRQAVGAKKISLLGFSYGTHLGLTTIRRHSEHLDSVILLGTEGLNHTLKFPSTFDEQLKKLSDLAAQDENVKAKVPDMVALLKRILEKLEKEPITVSVFDLRKNREVELKIGKFALQLLIRFDVGDSRDFVEFPSLFYTIDKGDYSILKKYAEKRYNQLGQGISGMSVMMDLFSGATDERLKRIQRETPNSLLGNTVNFPDIFVSDIWGNPDLGDDFRQNLQTKTRTLFVSGTLDSNTTTEQTEEICKGFNNGSHLVLEYAGHEDLLPNEQVQKAIVEFLNGREIGKQTITRPKPKFKPIPY